MSATIENVIQARQAPSGVGPTTSLTRLEIRRQLRNRRSVIFALVLPVVFFLIFGAGQSYSAIAVPHGNVAGAIMISMALYGAMLAATGAGASVALERTQGWSRQLRLTPLRPVAYIVAKVLAAMALGALSVLAVFAAGGLRGAHIDSVGLWIVSALLAWVGAFVFAAFGLFMGYLLRGDAVMQVLGPSLALLAFLGGLFIPLDQMSSLFATLAEFTPMYGLNQIAHAPLYGEWPGWSAVGNVLAWVVVFVGGAAWRFSRDTARV